MAVELVEGRNRQVRRMAAAIGHPTLRLLRVQIGDFRLNDLAAGQWRILNERERGLVLQPMRRPASGGRSSTSTRTPNPKRARAEPRPTTQ